MNIFISAGDVSGDIHAASLARALKKANPGVTITSIGGQKLETESGTFLYNLVNLGGFGFWAPVRLLELKALVKNVVLPNWDAASPDKVIVVDYYGFNIYIAKLASQRGIPVYYYISPQVWATRAGRVRKIAKYIKKMLVVLPFEQKLYRDAGVDAVFVGHPLLDIVPRPIEQPLVEKKITIGLFPGSRRNVFNRHIDILSKTVMLLKNSINADFKLFCVPELSNECKGLAFPVVVENSYEERKKISFAITTSGTVSLENALLGIPMVVFYRLSRFNYLIAKALVKIKYITMVNILLDKMLVPELLQNNAAPGKIAEKVKKILSDGDALRGYKNELLGLRGVLGLPGVSERAAGIILNS